MKNLIKLIDFIPYIIELCAGKMQLGGVAKALHLISQYVNFLKQPLELWMFVPCDLVMGKVVILEEPVYNVIDDQFYEAQRQKYQQAKERCLFKGFEITEEAFIHNTTHFYLEISGIKIMWNFNNKWVFYKGFKTIEDLVKYNPQLTPTAQKQIGYESETKIN